MKRIRVKAVSPLIAAVLLIVFTVAVGAVVLNWMTQYTKGTTEKAGTDTTSTVECAKQIIDIQDVRFTSDKNGNNYLENVTLFVQNLGTAKAVISTVSVYDDEGDTCENTSANVPLEPGAFKAFTPLEYCSSRQVSNTTFTVRVSTDCGSADTYKYTSS